MAEQTYWNGEPCKARKVTVEVAGDPERPRYWARGLVGTRRDAVEVEYGSETFYLDDEAWTRSEEEMAIIRDVLKWGEVDAECPAGQGWAKVTDGHGSPAFGHRELRAVEGSVQPR